MKYSYAVHVLLEELSSCESVADEGGELHYLECNEKRINDLRKALKKLGVDALVTIQDGPDESGGEGGGDPSGGGGGPGSDGSGGNP